MKASNQAMNVSPVCSHLIWDSNFFGYTIYKIEGWTEDEKIIYQIFQDLRRKDAKLVYWFVDREVEFPRAANALLVDIKIDYSRPTIQGNVLNENMISYSKDNTPDKLISLALASGEYSRFNIDPGFRNNEFEKLYRQWLLKSITREIADDVLAYEEEGNILGFVTYSFIPEDSIARIGLIAVDEGHRGKKIGKQLINASLYKAFDNGYDRLHVFTQGANKSACTFYEKCGFTVQNKTYIYHIWLY